jgi:hypothetical protein
MSSTQPQEERTPLTVRRVPVATLLPDPANVRVHPARNLEAIAASLKRFGQQIPVVVDPNGIVRKGNGTLLAARDILGWTEIDIVDSTLEGSEATAFAIADNRTAELAEWDWQGLAVQIGSLMDEGFPLEPLGFEGYEIEPLLKADFDPVSTTGDLAGMGDSGEGHSGGAPPIKLSAEQRQVFERACAHIRDMEGDPSITEGRCVELMAAEMLSGA